MVHACVGGDCVILCVAQLGCKGGLQGWVARVGCKGGLQGWVARVGCKGGLQGWVARVGCKGGVQGWGARVGCKGVLEWFNVCMYMGGGPCSIHNEVEPSNERHQQQITTQSPPIVFSHVLRSNVNGF